MKVHLKKCDIKSQKKVMKTIFKSIFFHCKSFKLLKKKISEKTFKSLIEKVTKI